MFEGSELYRISDATHPTCKSRHTFAIRGESSLLPAHSHRHRLDSLRGRCLKDTHLSTACYILNTSDIIATLGQMHCSLREAQLRGALLALIKEVIVIRA